jgi:short-subunit dehydrogenase
VLAISAPCRAVGLDVLVNNAGRGHVGAFDDTAGE